MKTLILYATKHGAAGEIAMLKKRKEILVVVGSGIENANTDTLAESFMHRAIEVEHTVSKVFLGDANISLLYGKFLLQRDFE